MGRIALPRGAPPGPHRLSGRRPALRRAGRGDGRRHPGV